MIPSVALPKHTTKLPVSGEEITFRPFLVKEEKILLLAAESGEVKDIVSATIDIVEACTECAVNRNSPMFDVMHMFLHIRGKSVGETLEFNIGCDNEECEIRTDVSVGVDDFVVTKFPNHTNELKFGNVTVVMRYPTFDVFTELMESDDVERIYNIVAKCIVRIITPDESIENDDPSKLGDFREFIENVTPEQFEKFEKFFDTMPRIVGHAGYLCKCGTKNEIKIDGVRHFFG